MCGRDCQRQLSERCNGDLIDCDLESGYTARSQGWVKPGGVGVSSFRRAVKVRLRSKSFVSCGLIVIGLMIARQHAAWAFIQKLFPLQEFIDDSDFLFTATVEKVDADKPSTVLVVVKNLKGEAPFARIPINLTGDKQKHTPQLLKRIAPDLPLVVGLKRDPSGKFMMLAYTNGTWFQVLGQTDGDQTRWAFTHCEIYLRRTFKGTTDELRQIIANVLAGKAKAPPANPKEPPGFGPPLGTSAAPQS